MTIEWSHVSIRNYTTKLFCSQVARDIPTPMVKEECPLGPKS